MRSTDLKRLILKRFGSKEFYGYDVHRVLALEGVEIEISRLYRVLNEMRNEELLEAQWVKSRKGPRKKVYKIGGKGNALLNDLFLDAIKTVHMFYGMYLVTLAPKINVFEELCQLLISDVRGDEKIAFITTTFSPMHERIIRSLHRKVPRGKLFLVKPHSLDVTLPLPNLVSFDGYYNDIPLRRDYVDCIVVIDLPKRETFERSMREWHKVLTPKGKLTILTPSILLDPHEAPLSIGAFIEKHEHETIEQGQPIEWAILDEQLSHYFNHVTRHSIVHMTIVDVAEPKTVSEKSL